MADLFAGKLNLQPQKIPTARQKWEAYREPTIMDKLREIDAADKTKGARDAAPES